MLGFLYDQSAVSQLIENDIGSDNGKASAKQQFLSYFTNNNGITWVNDTTILRCTTENKKSLM